MKDIKNVVICGLGAVGSIYAEKIENYPKANLKVLVDKQRLERYTQNPIIMNGKELIFDYILPESTCFKADLIIIATKFDGLNDAINNLKNFVKEDTIILSLLNGVTSEEIIANVSNINWEEFFSKFIEYFTSGVGNAVDTVISTVSTVSSAFVTFFISIIFSIYFLLSKENLQNQSLTLMMINFEMISN